MKQTYEQRVQSIAMEMLKDSSLVQNSHNLNTVFVPAARMAVEHMAYAYTLANLPHYHMDQTMLASGMGRINREMKELGLIPDQEPPKESAFYKEIWKVDGAIVDRSQEHYKEYPLVAVTLPCGYAARFWYGGLSDEEYIKRTQRLKEIDQAKDNMQIKGAQEDGKDETK